MKIAIIGAGIFGVTTAIHLSKNHDVDLFEKNEDILQSASGINQYRLHRGYHYPRSFETAKSAKKSEIMFRKEYEDAIINNVDHYYCISKEKSMTSRNQYLEFCKKNDLEYEEIDLNLMNKSKIDLTVKVKESLFDPLKLKKICKKKIKKNKVNLLMGKNIDVMSLQSYDYVVIATYANLNGPINHLKNLQINCQFEICEKPIVKIPSSLNKKSIVIMDGPFMCIDPYGKNEESVLGNVKHAIHHTNIGKFPEVPKEFQKILNKGIIKNPPITNFELFKKSGSAYIPEFSKMEHIGSMYTIRTVLPNVEKTDERPTLVNKIQNNVITVFSGKIGNCIEAANQVDALIK